MNIGEASIAPPIRTKSAATGDKPAVASSTRVRRTEDQPIEEELVESEQEKKKEKKGKKKQSVQKDEDKDSHMEFSPPGVFKFLYFLNLTYSFIFFNSACLWIIS